MKRQVNTDWIVNVQHVVLVVPTELVWEN